MQMAMVGASGRVARPFPCHSSFSAPRFNTTAIRTIGVKILNLGCPVLDGRVARPFPYHNSFSGRRFNTTAIRTIGVKILNLGCPVLDAFQGRGFWSDFPRPNAEMQYPMKG
jgi:hypothetical protein